MGTREPIPTGCPSVDRLLSGGVAYGAVTLVYGEASTGKTTLAASVALTLLRRDQAARAFYVDADGKLSTERLTQLAGGAEPLRRLLYYRPQSYREQTRLMEGLPDQLEAGDLVVVDSITGLYRLEAGDPARSFSENKELNHQLGVIREMALTTASAFLLTGQVRSVIGSPTPEVEPVAERLLRFWSDAVLRLDATPVPGVRHATLEKPESRRGAVRFRITGNGLEEADQAW